MVVYDSDDPRKSTGRITFVGADYDGQVPRRAHPLRMSARGILVRPRAVAQLCHCPRTRLVLRSIPPPASGQDIRTTILPSRKVSLSPQALQVHRPCNGYRSKSANASTPPAATTWSEIFADRTWGFLPGLESHSGTEATVHSPAPPGIPAGVPHELATFRRKNEVVDRAPRRAGTVYRACGLASAAA